MQSLSSMKAPISGGCLCGKVSYACNKSPVWSVNCHCKACQKLSGAPFVSAFSVPADCFSIDGPVVRFLRRSESGHTVTTTHCASCGSRICAQSAGATHLMNIFAATLSDDANYVAISNVYLSEAARWTVVPEAPFNFQKMPSR